MDHGKKHLSAFLQKCFAVEIISPLTLKKSEQMIELMEPHHQKSCNVVTLDTEDLYYSMEQAEL